MAAIAVISKCPTVMQSTAGAACWLVVLDIKSWLTFITIF
jgi:hypothetical protein